MGAGSVLLTVSGLLWESELRDFQFRDRILGAEATNPWQWTCAASSLSFPYSSVGWHNPQCALRKVSAVPCGLISLPYSEREAESNSQASVPDPRLRCHAHPHPPASCFLFLSLQEAEWNRKAFTFISDFLFCFKKIQFFLWCMVLIHFSLPPIKW